MSSKSKNLRAFVSSCENQKEETTPALVPKLRFPEFRGAEGWEQKTGDRLFDQINERNPQPGLPVLAITQEHGAIPRHMIDYHVSVTEKSIESYKVVQVGDFIISLRSFQGGIEYSQYHGICSPAYVILRKRGEASDAYFKHYLKTDRFIQILTKNLEGLRDGKMVSYAQFSELLVPVPKPPEQQKIAECLSSVDELIAAQARKLDALKTHKKGLMQQLFPREGETQPRLRFPEFQNAGEWAKMTLGQAATFYNGRAYKQEELLDSGKFPVLRVGNFFTNKNWYYSDLELDETKYCDDGDLLYAWSASFGPRVWHGGKVIYHYHIWKVEERRGIDRQFLFITLENETDRMKAQSANGLGLLHITKGTIEGWESSFPPQPAEQQRIASCLTSLDDLIAAQTQKLEALKTHKKGLMQQLFPSPEEQNTI
jgi:type I restriction enzyme S subunit